MLMRIFEDCKKNGGHKVLRFFYGHIAIVARIVIDKL